MPIPVATTDELVSALRRSSLPTVITEGYEDYLAFRRMEEQLSGKGVSFLPVGGKDTVLELFQRRGEFSHIPTAFIVDQDLWIFTGTPAEYQNASLISTEGYSIENDLYRDGDLENMLLGPEKARFVPDCDLICQWFSHVVRCHLDGKDIELDLHPNLLLLGPGTLNPAVLPNNFAACPTLYPQIFGDYAKYLRGKTLVYLLMKFLAAPGRNPKHKRRALLEFAASRDGALLHSIFSKIDQLF